MMRCMKTRFDSLPSRLRDVSTEVELSGVPCLLSQIDEEPRPFLFWMHGRTMDKELDPGRYLRCIRKGINVCAVDLPFHGSRYGQEQEDFAYFLQIVTQMAEEIDDVLADLSVMGTFDTTRCAIGGMSAGGLATTYRLCSEHPFTAAILECTGGAWQYLRETPIFRHLSREELDAVNPIQHLENWRDIPVLAVHSKHDSRVPYATESDFIEALKAKSNHPESIELLTFDRTGAPDEHMGFGRVSAFVKETEIEFLTNQLTRGDIQV